MLYRASPDEDALVADIPPCPIVHFDGGCHKKLGAGGFACFDPKGVCIGGTGEYYGRTCVTNNQAECRAMLGACVAIVSRGWSAGQTDIIVRGDSRLVIGFMTRSNKVSNPDLIRLVNQTKVALEPLRRKCKVHWQFVPREQNQWADWLVGQAFRAEG